MRRIGFVGKLPARGDFVRSLVRREVAENVEAWTARVLPAMRRHMQRQWGEASARRWAEAPPLRFALSPPGWLDALSGVWLPSRDAVGRHYPLVICLETTVAAASLLDEAAVQGRRAIADVEPPERLAQRLAALPEEAAPEPAPGPPIRWWRGTALRYEGAQMPDAAAMCRMLDDEEPA